MEKVQRFSIRKLSIGAVSCLIGTVAFLGYSHDVQAAETPQTVETVKVQENKRNAETSGNAQNAAINKDVVESQKTDALTTINQASPNENAPATNKAVVTNKVETNTLSVETDKDSTPVDDKQDFPKGDQEADKK